jgi:hypothetical protein
MAVPGIGYRRVWDLAIEISFHMLQPVVFTALSNSIPLASPNVVQTAQVPSTANMYAGAQLVIDTGTNQEIVTVIAVTTTSSPPGPAFTAIFSKSHAAGVMVAAATFPLQAATDPLFTQAEIALYIARAQNQFLFDVPCIFQITHQTVNQGKIIQSSPLNAVEMEHVAGSSLAVQISSLTRNGNTVTAVTKSPHGLSAGSPFSIFSSGTAFAGDGAFSVATVISSTSFTYSQIAANGSSTTGFVVLWTRLYETSQEELNMSLGQSWRNQFLAALNFWFEDRTGLYQWGVGGLPGSNFPVEIISSMRDSDTLALTDGFLAPDLLLHGIKYLALNYCFSKEGEARNPLLAQYCRMRYDRIVFAARRWMSAVGLVVAPEAGLVGGGGRRI